MLKRPGGLEELAKYAVGSNIPPEFAKAVDVVSSQVFGDPKYKELGNRYRTISDRLFRSSAPFKFEEEAEYAIFLGKAVGLVKALTTESNPNLIIDLIDNPRDYEQYKLKEPIYNAWAIARTHAEVSFDHWPFPLNLIEAAKLRLGLRVSQERINEVPVFLEDYFSDPTHRREMLFHADLV